MRIISKDNVKTISVCVVALNEKEYLPKLLDDIKNQTYPHSLIEVVLVDSGSTDGTKEIMEEFKNSALDFFDVQILDNPKRKQSCGWNVAIANAKMEALARIDAHSHIPSDFVEKNMENLASGEAISGGIRPCLIINDNPWSRILLQTENSMFGSSANSCRRSTKKQYVKTMFHATYLKEVFDKVGGFNEELGRTEDNELHYRMGQAGYKFCFDPEIISYQYARSSLKKMLKQKFGNGYWIGLTLGVCPGCLSVFHFVPFAFVSAILFAVLLLCFGILWPIIALAIAYGSVAVLMSVKSVLDSGWNNFCFVMPILFFLLHSIYGVGTLVGLIKMPFWARKIKK